jgi:hypothetical protein
MATPKFVGSNIRKQLLPHPITCLIGSLFFSWSAWTDWTKVVEWRTYEGGPLFWVIPTLTTIMATACTAILIVGVAKSINARRTKLQQS